MTQAVKTSASFLQCNRRKDLRFGILVAVRTRWLFGDVSRVDLPTRNAIFLAGPLIEIDQLASFRTERPPRVVLPFNRLSARRTFQHKAKVRRTEGKVKRRAVRLVLSERLGGVKGLVLALSQLGEGWGEGFRAQPLCIMSCRLRLPPLTAPPDRKQAQPAGTTGSLQYLRPHPNPLPMGEGNQEFRCRVMATDQICSAHPLTRLVLTSALSDSVNLISLVGVEWGRSRNYE